MNDNLHGQFDLVATTYAGLESVLAEELIAIGADNVQPVRRAVYFSGSQRLIYLANYSLRTALRILMPVKKFKLANADDLYRLTKEIPWEDYFDVKKDIAVQSTIFSDLFRSSMYASLRVKDAIADRFREKLGNRPSVRLTRPDIVINVHIAGNQCTLSLDSSGESLHKRGYREKGHEAPISEVLAAGLISMSRWSKAESLLDPMCGSGTFLIEAAMMAANIRPGDIGRNYCFENWSNFNSDLLEQIKSDASPIDPDFAIYGSDISPVNVNHAAANIERAKVDDIIRLRKIDFRKLEKRPNNSFLIFNPPYGERLKEGDSKFYDSVGEHLKHHYTGCEVWMISTPDCLKHIGLRPAVKIPILNGSLECSFRKYELYSGSKKSN